MKLTVVTQEDKQELVVPIGGTVLEYLQNVEIPVHSACGGKGSCQKCRVKISGGFAATSESDKKAFIPQELEQGWRLSCQLRPRTSLEILVPSTESVRRAPRTVILRKPKANEKLVLACDLGSTGVVLALGTPDGESLIEVHLLNQQVIHGYDVMTRLQVAQEKGPQVLTDLIWKTLDLCWKQLKPHLLDSYQLPSEIYFSGNSAMVTFLHSWNTESLAVVPFQPEKKESTTTARQGLQWTSLPLFGGFVGADTCAGVVAIEKNYAAKTWLLVDVGTNTELVLKDHDGVYWFCSAPAGPAFEGGNITHGMRAEPGAITEATRKNGQWKFETVGKDRAKGICGSGLIEVIAESVAEGIIHQDGFVPERNVLLTETIFLSAEDVREFQLAKSATFTGIEILLERANIKPEKIFLAGQFAQYLNVEKAVAVGLLPQGYEYEKIGNSSLQGSLIYAGMKHEEKEALFSKMNNQGRQIELALQDDFQDRFVRNLNFL